MKEIKSVGEYKIYEKKSGRYAIKDVNKKFINGEEKTKILVSAGLITVPEPKPAPVEQVEEDASQADEKSDQ